MNLLNEGMITRDIARIAYYYKLTDQNKNFSDPDLYVKIDYQVALDNEILYIRYKNKYINYALDKNWNKQSLDDVSENILKSAIIKLCCSINPCHMMLISSKKPKIEDLLTQILQKL